MNKEEKSVFDLVEGMTAVDPNQLADFQRAMTEEIIPEIVRVVEERRAAAAETYHCQLRH